MRYAGFAKMPPPTRLFCLPSRQTLPGKSCPFAWRMAAIVKSKEPNALGE
jgi:hypothetical protein